MEIIVVDLWKIRVCFYAPPLIQYTWIKKMWILGVNSLNYVVFVKKFRYRSKPMASLSYHAIWCQQVVDPVPRFKFTFYVLYGRFNFYVVHLKDSLHHSCCVYWSAVREVNVDVELYLLLRHWFSLLLCQDLNLLYTYMTFSWIIYCEQTDQ